MNLTSAKNWKTVKLGDVAEVVGGGTPSTKESAYWDGDISWITPKDLSNYQSVYIVQGERSITEEGVKNSSARLLPKNSILFSSRAPIGYVAINNIPVTTNQGFKSLIPKDGTDYKFLYYWLLHNAGNIEKQASGSTFAEVSGSVMKNISISLPILDEQREIAGVLGSLDDKIELLRKENKTLESIAQTLFKEWFVNFNFPFDSAQGKPDSTGKMTDSELGPIPAGWRVGKLGDVCDISIGRTPPRKEEEWFSKNPKDVKWISIKDMGTSGAYIFQTSEYLTQEAVENFNVPVIPENTVVVSFKMTLGRVAITTEEMLSNEAIAHLKTKEKMSPEFLYLAMKSFDFNSLGSTSSIVSAVNSQSIKRIEIIIPDKETMSAFDYAVKPIFQKLKVNSKEIQTLSKLRDELLNNIFTN